MIHVCAELVMEAQGQVGYRLAVRLIETDSGMSIERMIYLRPVDMLDQTVFSHVFTALANSIVEAWREQ